MKTIEYKFVKALYIELEARLSSLLEQTDPSSTEFEEKMDSLFRSMTKWLNDQIKAETEEVSEILNHELNELLNIAFSAAVPKEEVSKGKFRRLVPKGETAPISRVKAMLASFETILFSYEHDVDESRAHAMEVFSRLATDPTEGGHFWDLFVAKNRNALIPVEQEAMHRLRPYIYDGSSHPKIGEVTYVKPEAQAIIEGNFVSIKESSAAQIKKVRAWMGDISSLTGKTLAAFVVDEDRFNVEGDLVYRTAMDGGLNLHIIGTNERVSSQKMPTSPSHVKSELFRLLELAFETYPY